MPIASDDFFATDHRLAKSCAEHPVHGMHGHASRLDSSSDNENENLSAEIPTADQPPSDLLEATNGHRRRHRPVPNLRCDPGVTVASCNRESLQRGCDVMSPTIEILSPAVETADTDFIPVSVASMSQIVAPDMPSLVSVELLSTRNAANSVAKLSSIRGFEVCPDGCYAHESAWRKDDSTSVPFPSNQLPQNRNDGTVSRDISLLGTTNRFSWGSFHQEKKKKAKVKEKHTAPRKEEQESANAVAVASTATATTNTGSMSTLKRGFSGIFGKMGSSSSFHNSRPAPTAGRKQ